MGLRIAVTPLKLQSQRVPGKNFRELGGMPLYQWSLRPIRELRDAGVFDQIGVYGEAAIGDRLSADVVLYPEKVVVAAQDGNVLFRDMMLALPPDVEWCCIFNATSPFTRRESFEEAMQAVTSGKYDSAASVHAVRGRLWDTARLAMNHDPWTCPRTQTQEPVYLESDAFWILKPSLLLEHSRRIGFRPWFQEVAGIELIDIDTEADWELAEYIGAGICQRP